MKKLCSSKDTINGVKIVSKHMERETMFSKHISDNIQNVYRTLTAQ